MKELNNKGFAISTLLYGIFILFMMVLAVLVASFNSSLRLLNDKVNNVNDYEEELEEFYVEPPDLSTGLIPVVYKEDIKKWVVADVESEEEKWYDYKRQEWANAVSVKSSSREKYVDGNKYKSGEEIVNADLLAMFVWIPRFSYTIGCHTSSKCYGYRIKGGSELHKSTPGAIDIKFIKKNDRDSLNLESGEYPKYNYSVDSNGYPTNNRKPDNLYTHPAFWWDIDGDENWDDNENLAGFWVGKFETSVDTSSSCYNDLQKKNCDISLCKHEVADVTPRIKPDVLSLNCQNSYNQFMTARKFTENSLYGLAGDSHMMKNTEWSAVTYLSQSIYGKYGNSNFEGIYKKIFINNSGKYWKGGAPGIYVEYFYNVRTGRSAGTLDGFTSNGYYKYDGTSTRGDKFCKLCGTGASTTGNIYGVYDMAGGNSEYVLGYNVAGFEEGYSFGTNSAFDYVNDSGFSEPIDKKYYDTYRSNLLNDITPKTTGHATYETKSWYGAEHEDFSISYPWLIRGNFFNDNSGGVFNFGSSDHGCVFGEIDEFLGAFRVVLSK